MINAINDTRNHNCTGTNQIPVSSTGVEITLNSGVTTRGAAAAKKPNGADENEGAPNGPQWQSGEMTMTPIEENNEATQSTTNEEFSEKDKENLINRYVFLGTFSLLFLIFTSLMRNFTNFRLME